MTDDPNEVEGGEELVDGLPILAEVRPVERAPAGAAPANLPAVQAAAAAITGFVAGAATLAMVRRRQGRRLARREPGGAFGLLPAGGTTRTFVVHVRRIGREEE